MLHQQSSIHSLNNPSNNGPRTSPLRKSPRGIPGGVPVADRIAGDVDLNDPETLSFYTELTLFRNDPDREDRSSILPTSLLSSAALSTSWRTTWAWSIGRLARAEPAASCHQE